VGELNILVVGVGGQGILTLSRVLGEAAVASNLDVLVAETHGLSQRGGSVAVHVRIGWGVEAPLIPQGEADIVLGLELLEALRAAPSLRRSGVIVADLILIPPSIPGVKAPSLEDVVGALRSLGVELHLVHASDVAKKLGDVRVANMYLLGYAYQRTRLRELLEERAVENAILRLPNPELNLKAFKLGLAGGGV